MIEPERLPALDAGNRATIPEGWLQGRTAYGGASAALALIAAKRLLPMLPPLRSAQIAFIGPIAGEVEVAATILRQGKSSVWIEAAVHSAGTVGLRALFLFMHPRESSVAFTGLAMPDVPAPDPRPVATIAPSFIHNFAIAECDAPKAGFRRWARLLSDRPSDAEVELIAMGDMLPPAALALATSFGPISSATWQLNVVGAPSPPADGWYLVETTTLDANHGASSQAMTMWTSAGTPVATGTQSVALFM